MVTQTPWSLIILATERINEAFIYTPLRRVGTVPTAAVQYGPIALPDFLQALSAAHKSFVCALGQLTRSLIAKNFMPAEPSMDESQRVTTYIANLQHPLFDDVIELRKLILKVDRSIGESIKWNAPSFYTTEHFATMRLSGKPLLQLILHLGTKKQTMPADAIADPNGLLTWLGPDRASINFPTAGSVAATRSQLTAILKQWIRHVPAAGKGR